jgi:hypothetical protein
MKPKTKPREILLRNRRTHSFLSWHNEWTGQRKEARLFQDSASAVAHVLNHSLVEAQLVVRSGQPDNRQWVIPISCSMA